MTGEERGRTRAWVVVLAILAVVTVIVVVLLTGRETNTDPSGDLSYVRGSSARPREPNERLAASIADIVAAEITHSDGDYLFVAEVGGPIPRRLEEASLEVRWDLSTEDGSSWTISAVLEKRLEASVFSSTNGFGAGTVDGTLPGEVSKSINAVTIRLTPGVIEGFPDQFEWSLSTALIAFRDDPRSPRVEDRFPDMGTRGLTP